MKARAVMREVQKCKDAMWCIGVERKPKENVSYQRVGEGKNQGRTIGIRVLMRSSWRGFDERWRKRLRISGEVRERKK